MLRAVISDVPSIPSLALPANNRRRALQRDMLMLVASLQLVAKPRGVWWYDATTPAKLCRANNFQSKNSLHKQCNDISEGLPDLELCGVTGEVHLVVG